MEGSHRPPFSCGNIGTRSKYAASALPVAKEAHLGRNRSAARQEFREGSRIWDHRDLEGGSHHTDPGADVLGARDNPGSRGRRTAAAAVGFGGSSRLSHPVVDKLETSGPEVAAAAVEADERPAAEGGSRSQSWEKHCSCWRAGRRGDPLEDRDEAGMALGDRGPGRRRREGLG